LRLPCAETMNANAISNSAAAQTRRMLFMTDSLSRSRQNPIT
jgi:hypothetical protein